MFNPYVGQFLAEFILLFSINAGIVLPGFGKNGQIIEKINCVNADGDFGGQNGSRIHLTQN